MVTATTARSVVKWVDVDVPSARAFAFLSDPMNWPRWAVVNLRSVSQGADGWFNMTTRQGSGQLKLHRHEELGVLDHTWKDEQASWRVFGRVVPNAEGATVMFTFFRPAMMDDAQFDAAMQEMDVEMAKLREVLEEGE